MKSPCNDICTIDRPSGLCIGCGRNLSEIAEWGAATEERQRDIREQLPARMATLGEKAKR